MNISMVTILSSALGLGAGALIGFGFGKIQELAWRRNQKLQDAGSLNNGWAVMPGSMKRVGYLLICLVLIQLVCPLLFKNGTEWWVSGGVLLGYGSSLFQRLRKLK
jgi:hypothetical protein